MSIWKKNLNAEELISINENTLGAHLGIVIEEIGDEYIRATMPVDSRTRQFMGNLHGGASVALAETIGSIGANLAAEPGYQCVGLEINANHIRPVSEGIVTGIAKPVHIGRRTMVWEIEITNEQNQRVCVARLTLAVLKSAGAEQ